MMIKYLANEQTFCNFSSKSFYCFAVMKLEGGKRGQCPNVIPLILIPHISQKLFFNYSQTKLFFNHSETKTH